MPWPRPARTHNATGGCRTCSAATCWGLLSERAAVRLGRGGLQTAAVRDADGYVLNGTKAWITHGGIADFYTVMTRTAPDRTAGITAFLVPGDAPGLSAATPERKMGCAVR